ncbi:MAG TPA: hypothetical protein VGG64_30245 [Pirellulales bacterium]|jgi:hypothetical protein
MYTFQITLHARPAEALPGGSIEINGQRYSTLDVPAQVQGTGFSVSFEETSVALAQLPRMFIEPDGSFVWVSPAGERAWQVDGVLYDRDERLQFIDLKGTCPAAAFDQVLSAVDWPTTAVMLQLTREAVFVDEATFRSLAVA